MKKFQVEHTLTDAQIKEANINEGYFYPDDGWPECVGYCIGPDDGKSTMYVTPNDAYKKFKGLS
jgi:hypothetical protein